MTTDEAIAIVRQRWDAADGCGSCGWKSCLYEHEPIEVDEEDIARGYVRFPCLSEDASENGGHRGIRVYFTDQEGADPCGS